MNNAKQYLLPGGSGAAKRMASSRAIHDGETVERLRRDLKRNGLARRRAAARHERARRELEEVIYAALDVGMPQREIAKLAGLTPGRVGQLASARAR
jgi:hypothetical protein